VAPALLPLLLLLAAPAAACPAMQAPAQQRRQAWLTDITWVSQNMLLTGKTQAGAA
jgi:hypothetical protein